MEYRFLVLIFSLVTCVANAQFPWDNPIKKGIWDYPVKPGTEEWKQLRSHDEMLRACQIPEDLLSILSTEDLTDLCLRYPALWFINVFNNTNTGLDNLFDTFNGIRELYKRKEVSTCLTRRYVEKIQSFPFLDTTKNRIGAFVISVSVLEGLLSRIERQDHLEDNLKEVLQALVVGYDIKVKYPDNFKGIGFQSNFYARSHVLAKMEPSFVERLPKKEKNGAFYSGMVSDEQTIHIINELSYQLIK